MFLFRPPFPTPKNYFVNFKRRKTEVLKTLNWTFEVLAGDIRDCSIFEIELISKSFRSKLKTCKKPFNYDLRNLILFSRGWYQTDKSIMEFWNANSRDFFLNESNTKLITQNVTLPKSFEIPSKTSNTAPNFHWLSFQFLRCKTGKFMEFSAPEIFLELVLNWWVSNFVTAPWKNSGMQNHDDVNPSKPHRDRDWRLAFHFQIEKVTLEFQSPWLSLNLTEPDCNSKSLLARGQSKGVSKDSL